MSVNENLESQQNWGNSTGPTDQDQGGQAGQQGNQGKAEGQPNINDGVNYEDAYKELEKRFGAQGNELGEYREFFQNVSPLLEKLDTSPELVQAILDGKIDGQLAKAVYEGKVSVSEAQAVTQANEEVQKEVKEGEHDNASPQQIEALIEKKAQEIRRELEEKADLTSFEQKTQQFMESTPDFADYADEIDKWLDQHDVTDIEVAYYAVKGQMSSAAAAKAADQAAAERSKELAQNMQGGGVSPTHLPDGTPVIDSLVAGRSNPNAF